MADHDFDAIASFVFSGVVFDWFSARFSTWHAGPDLFFLQGISEPDNITTPVRQHPLRRGKAVQQSRGSGVITDIHPAVAMKLSGRASSV